MEAIIISSQGNNCWNILFLAEVLCPHLLQPGSGIRLGDEGDDRYVTWRRRDEPVTVSVEQCLCVELPLCVYPAVRNLAVTHRMEFLYSETAWGFYTEKMMNIFITAKPIHKVNAVKLKDPTQ